MTFYVLRTYSCFNISFVLTANMDKQTVVSSGSGVSSGAGRDVFIGNLSLFTDNAKLR